MKQDYKSPADNAITRNTTAWNPKSLRFLNGDYNFIFTYINVTKIKCSFVYKQVLGRKHCLEELTRDLFAPAVHIPRFSGKKTAM